MLRPLLTGRNHLLRREPRLIHSSAAYLRDPEDGEGNKKNAADKLNSLLLTIAKVESVPKAASKVRLPKPTKSRLAKTIESLKVSKEKTLGEKLVNAAEGVAKSIGGPPKETEAKLLHKLLYKDEKLKEEVLKSASDNESLSSLLKTMKVEQEAPPEVKSVESMRPMTRADQIRSLVGKKKYITKSPSDKSEGKVLIFGSKPLGIFNPKTAVNEGIKLKTWDKCHERELKLSITHPPASYYEQMISWTEAGKLWKFPIDNEQGLEEEKKVSFSEHVFLENHLEGWCPLSGPVRHFMELVCVGLSRNHWLTADEKKAHIMWYKEFFLQKKELLKEIGAGTLGVASSPEASN